MLTTKRLSKEEMCLINVRAEKPKERSRMDNPETLATFRHTRHRTKTQNTKDERNLHEQKPKDTTG